MYEISAPPKEFPSINGNYFIVNLTKNVTSIYQAQGAFCGEAIGKFDVKYKSICNRQFKKYINKKDFKNFDLTNIFKSQLVNQYKHRFLALSLIRKLNQI